ncbi:MAG: ABC transporter permease [Actinomycetota bacterium]|nr:ABC transporter permease [Actinomycetota bacterium]
MLEARLPGLAFQRVLAGLRRCCRRDGFPARGRPALHDELDLEPTAGPGGDEQVGAVGATRRHVALQFLTESLVLSAAGAVAGISLGAAVSFAYATTQE